VLASTIWRSSAWNSGAGVLSALCRQAGDERMKARCAVLHQSLPDYHRLGQHCLPAQPPCTARAGSSRAHRDHRHQLAGRMRLKQDMIGCNAEDVCALLKPASLRLERRCPSLTAASAGTSICTKSPSMSPPRPVS